VVFVIDPVLPLRDVAMDVEPTISQEDWDLLDQSLLKVDGQRNEILSDRRGNIVLGYNVVYIESPQGNLEVAKQHFQAMPLLQSLGHFFNKARVLAHRVLAIDWFPIPTR